MKNGCLNKHHYPTVFANGDAVCFLRLGVLRRICGSVLSDYHSLHLMNSDIFQKRFPIV
jgi:hypothetical protein